MNGATQPADLGDRVYAPELIEENEYYLQSWISPEYKRIFINGIETLTTGDIRVYVRHAPEVFGVIQTTPTDNNNYRFWKIRDFPYAPPNRNLVGNRISPQNVEEGGKYYVRSGFSPYEEITVNRIRVSPRNARNRAIFPRPSVHTPQGTRYSTGPQMDPAEHHKFYKVKGHMYRENAARKILPFMYDYSSRPPKTMSEEDEGGRLYKLYQQQFKANLNKNKNGGSRRRRQTKRKNRK